MLQKIAVLDVHYFISVIYLLIGILQTISFRLAYGGKLAIKSLFVMIVAYPFIFLFYLLKINFDVDEIENKYFKWLDYEI